MGSIHFVIEKLTNSSNHDECISHLLPILDSPTNDSFDMLDQVFTLFEVVENKSVFQPFFHKMIPALYSHHLLQSYFTDLPLSTSSILWLIQYILQLEEESFFALLLLLFGKYQAVNRLEVGLFCELPLPTPSSFIFPILKLGNKLLIQKKLENIDFFLTFLNSITKDFSEVYSNVLVEVLSYPHLASFKSEFIQTSVSQQIIWRLDFISHHVSLFIDSSDYRTLFLLLNCHPLFQTNQVDFVNRCYTHLFSSFSLNCLEHIPSTGVLIRSFIPFFIEWSVHQSQELFSKHKVVLLYLHQEMFIQGMVDHNLLETMTALLQQTIPQASLCSAIKEYSVCSTEYMIIV